MQSTNFPEGYPNNHYQIWRVRAPDDFTLEVRVEVLYIQKDADYLYIGNSDDGFDIGPSGQWMRLTGSLIDLWLNTTFSSNNSSATIVFTSDGSHSDRGLAITCWTIGNNEQTILGKIRRTKTEIKMNKKTWRTKQYCHPFNSVFHVSIA